MSAHQPRRKQALRRKRREAGKALAEALASAGNTEGSLHAFALHDYLNHDNDRSAATDPRWTFGKAADGFDIVIGNPPYVRPREMGESKAAVVKRQARRNGYHSFDDLFALFCEAALELSHPNRGVISLVVPLSLSFAARKSHIRDSYFNGCRSIALRHQDNRPDTTFGNSPVMHAENRQRTTVITAVRGKGKCKLLTSGLGRWFRNERPRYFQQRQYVGWNMVSVRGRLNADLAGQRPRLCTREAAEIIVAVAKLGSGASWTGTASIGMPKSAMYFVTVAPAGWLNRRESHLWCTRRDVNVALAVLNSGIAYLWWKAWGDGFDVKVRTFSQMPNIAGFVDRAELSSLGTRIRRTLRDGERDMRQSGTGGGRLTENVNLWEAVPDVLHDVDSRLLAGLGFDDVDRYLQVLALERSNSVLTMDRS